MEEFERILDQPIKDHDPFPKLEEDVTKPKIASDLGLDVNEVVSYWALRGVFKGFRRKFLEDQDLKCIKEEKCDAYYAILALLIHGIVLFPNIDNVDHLVVEIFLSGNPMPFLLVDFYHTFHTRHEKKSRTFLFCPPLMHMWMSTHMPQEGPFISKDLSWNQGFG